MNIDHRHLKEMLLGLGVMLLGVVAFGVIIFLASKQIESLVNVEQQEVANKDIRATWDILVGRIDNQDRAAVDELLNWSKMNGHRFIQYQTDRDSEFIFFYRTNDYRTDEFNQLPNALLIKGNKTLKVVDLGHDNLKAVGTTEHETFLFKKDIRGYTGDSSEGCRWDQSFFEVNTTGTMDSPITYSECDGARKLVFHLENGEDIIFEFVEESDVIFSTNALVLKTESGSLLELPHDSRGDLSEDVLTSFLRTGDRSVLHFPRYSQSFGQATTTLYLRPVPHLDEESTAINNCKSQWEFSIADVRDGSKEQLVVIEECMDILHYPFKKFPIPGTASYYGFMGNGSNIGEDYVWSPGGVAENSVWCQIDGLPNGCMLYKVQNGGPNLLVSPNHGRGVEGPSLTQLELLRANKDGSLLVHRFPYEIIYFQDYYNYDFVNGTTTDNIIEYSGGGDWGQGFVSSTLTFYPAGQAVELWVDNAGYTGEEWNPTVTLFYKDQALLSFKESEENGRRGLVFPRPKDLATYALQSDKTKFHFSAGESEYTLDLSPEIPKLIKAN